MNPNHAKFLQHLHESQSPVWAVARWLNQHGYAVSIPPGSAASKHEDWKSHADNGDLYITQRVEVKRLSVDFTSREDWPFRDKFIVCAKHAFDRARPKPHAYVILSASSEFAAIVEGRSHKTWFVEARTDSRYQNVRQDFYLAPLESVVFTRLAPREEPRA